MTNKEIREAKDELYRLSMDEKERELYYIREKSIRDEISALANAEEKGIEKGIEEGIELTKKVFKLFQKGNSITDIANICKITEDKVKEILE